MNLHDIVFCVSGNGQPYVGYVSRVYPNNQVVIQWWYHRARMWSETERFDAASAGVVVLGPMPKSALG